MMILLDAGHGGIEEGKYVTPGKRYYGLHEGKEIQMAEGAFNRAVVHGIAARLHLFGVKCHIINPENEDISLHARARRVNEIAKREKCVLLSVHHNAFEDERVSGFEVFTSMGDTPSDPIADFIGKKFTEIYPNVKLRRESISPNRYSKDAGYYILRSTRCPAILTEWAFMTNPVDRDRMICYLDDQIGFLTRMMVWVAEGKVA